MTQTTINIFQEHKDLNFKCLLKQYGYGGLIPSNFLINKYRTGIGATTCEIEALRHSIIIAPYVEILRVKKVKHDKSIAIMMDGVSSIDIIDYLNDASTKFKKIMVVPEGFARLIKTLIAEWPTYRQDFFLLFDECEKLVEDCLFRRDIIKPMEEFFLFKSKALISATPIIPSDPRFNDNGFELLKLKPAWDFRTKLKLITTQNINTSLRNHLSLIRDGKPVFFFTNCKRTILYLTQCEAVKKDFKIFCSDVLASKYFIPHGVPACNIDDSVTGQEYAQFNIFTSRFYSGIDMIVEGNDLPHIVFITNLPHIRHSIVNPYTTAIQIMGRCRQGISSVTHITSIDTVSKPIVDVYKEVDFWIMYNQKLRQARQIFSTKNVQDGLSMLIDKEFINVLFENDEVNTYHRDSFISRLKVLTYYTSASALADAYKDSGYFILEHADVKQPRSELDKLVLDRKVNKKQSIRIVLHLETLENELDRGNPLNEEDIEWALRVEEKHTVLFELFCEFGAPYFEEIKYHKTKMVKSYIKHKLSLRSNRYADMVDTILTHFKPNVRYYSDVLAEELQQIYDKYSYSADTTTRFKACANDILYYFEAKYNDGKYRHPKHGYKTSYIIGQPKLKLSSDLHALYTNKSPLH